MKTVKKLLAAAVLSVSLSGCTAMMWNHDSPFHTTYQREDKATESIHAFGMVKQNGGQLQQGSLVMMGGKLWFAVNPDDSAKLLNVLNVKLDRAFTLKHLCGVKESMAELPVELEEANSNRFRSRFCLSYTTDKKAEQTQLEKAGFKPSEKDPNVWYYPVDARGEYFAVPSQMLQLDYRFETSVPVKMFYMNKKTDVDVAHLLVNIIATPYTLTLDAGALVVWLPLAAVGVLVQAVRDRE